MSEKISTTYHGTEICYDESESQWVFTLRNRERTAASLKEAKISIDKPVRETKEKPFEPIDAWKINWSGAEITKGKVTSIAAKPTYRQTNYVWFVNSDGVRTKEATDVIFPDTPDNNVKFSELREINRQIELLAARRGKVHDSLAKLKVEE